MRVAQVQQGKRDRGGAPQVGLAPPKRSAVGAAPPARAVSTDPDDDDDYADDEDFSDPVGIRASHGF